MSTSVSSLDQLDPARVQAAQTQMTTMLSQTFPSLALRNGVLHDLLLYFHAITHTVITTDIERTQSARSLLQIAADPTLADATTVDHLLSNYMLTRKTGQRADGALTIVVTGNATMVIAANSKFTANGLAYRTNIPITARPPGTTATALNERTLVLREDGTYEFVVPVTAEEVGDNYNLRVGIAFTPEPPPARFVAAYSAIDFTGGRSEETNQEILSRLSDGVAAKVAAGRTNIAAMIRDQTAFADTHAISIVGFGDPEMTRDQHGVIPVSGGGRIDIYCQSTLLPITKTVQVTATLAVIRGADSVWQFAITRDIAPGFYGVTHVRRLIDPPTMGGFEISSDVRSWSFVDDVWQPDIINATESLYTRYQTAAIQFIDTATNTSGLTVGASAIYAVDILTQENIGEIQDYLNTPAARHLTADMLVKSAIPCFLSIELVIERSSQESAPDLEAIRTAIAAMVNSQGFGGTLYGTQVTSTVNNYLTGSQAVASVLLRGRIRKPDGTYVSLRDSMTITIPELPSIGITPRTTCFVLYPDNISLSVNLRRT